MTDRPKPPANETPIERALRLKKAAQEAKQQPPGGKGRRAPATGIAPGASKPWMKK